VPGDERDEQRSGVDEVCCAEQFNLARLGSQELSGPGTDQDVTRAHSGLGATEVSNVFGRHGKIGHTRVMRS
jgi:hypothetical protein